MQVPLRCRCGHLQGMATDVSAHTGVRLICYCDDCQAFARFLGRDGILDGNGGTEIFQTAPSQVRLTAGREHVRCVRLSDQGLMRWFAGCCRTPIGNTFSSARVPFVGVLRAFMDPSASGLSPDQALGPVRGWIHTESATGKPPHGPPVPLGLILRSLRFLTSAWISGKRRPSPFFDPSTGRPVVQAQVLTRAERDALRMVG